MLNFITRSNSGGSPTPDDVDVAVSKAANRNGEVVTVRIAKRCMTPFTGTGYLICAEEGSKLYIKQSGSEGFKIQGAESNRPYFRIKRHRLKTIREPYGDFKLLYDNGYNLWYIDTARPMQ